MKKYNPLKPEQLRSSLPPSAIPYASSLDIPASALRSHPQKRVMEALKLGLHIKTNGYNIFVAGEPDLGRRYMLREYLTPRAKKEATPPDLIYVYNFDNADNPHLVSVPAGLGKEIKNGLHKMLTKVQKDLNLNLENANVASKRFNLFDNFQNQRSDIIESMDKIATGQGFHITFEEDGMTLYPSFDGKKLDESELAKLDSKERDKIRVRGKRLVKSLSGLMRQVTESEQVYLEKERTLQQDILKELLRSTFDPFVEKTLKKAQNTDLEAYFKAMREDMLENHAALVAPEPMQNAPSSSPLLLPGMLSDSVSSDELHERYTVNIFVDNSGLQGAPIVFEDHPTLSNLMGSIEREAEMGALITHFTLIKSGAIHKANGGYLVLHAEDILRHPGAWEALIRSLRSGIARIEDASEDEAAKTKGIQPDSVPLQLKVILVGDENLYELLLAGDERFSKLFKIKAHLTEHMPRNKAGIRFYLASIRKMIDEHELLPFTQGALAGLVDYGSLIIEDQTKLSLMLPRIFELMVESSALASLNGQAMVDEKTLEIAQDARQFRSNLVEEAYMEEYDNRIIKVITRGEAIGRVNGLAVSVYGDFEFGLPHQISCTVGAGSGGIIDLERDAQLSGPIHTKAMMILKTYLVGAFAHNKPLTMTGSLGFEQNYVGIEGDSASGAELAALLSALAQVPLSQSLAFTGAVGQAGEIMAVGGITHKVEGYFEVCRRHGLTGKQGVIMPADNLVHLMVHNDVIEAVAKKKFHIYPVNHITEAMEILTGHPAGKLRKNGTYTVGSIYAKADQRLTQLAKLYNNRKKR